MARLFCVALIVSFAPVLAEAQPRTGIDVGTAVPTGELATFRSPGVAVTGSLGTRRPGLSARGELALAHLPASAAGPGVNSGQGDYTSVGARLSLLLRGAGRVAPYGYLGAGIYTIQIANDRSPYGSVFGGAHVGAGMEIPVGSAALALEVGAVAMATDYGAGAFNFPTVHVPITVGVRF